MATAVRNSRHPLVNSISGQPLANDLTLGHFYCMLMMMMMMMGRMIMMGRRKMMTTFVSGK